MELVGYIFRTMSSRNTFVVIRFVLNYFFIVCVSKLCTSPNDFANFFTCRHRYSSVQHCISAWPNCFQACLLAQALLEQRLLSEVRLCLLIARRVLLIGSAVPVFVAIDTVTIIMQIVGAALIGAGYSAQGDGRDPAVEPENANWILLTGLCVQVNFSSLSAFRCLR
jgi:hypothetical protein